MKATCRKGVPRRAPDSHVRAPAGLDKPPAWRLAGCKVQRRSHKGPERVWQAPGGAAWRVQNVDISVAFIWFPCVACMPCLFVMLWVLAGAQVEPKAGFVDSAWVF